MKPITDEQLDRLVDGELTSEQRHKLLTQLEDCEEKKGAWRRVALAFLESQLFREALGDFSLPPAQKETPKPQPQVSSLPRKRKWLRFSQYFATLGICCIAAFSIGDYYDDEGGLWGTFPAEEADPSGDLLHVTDSKTGETLFTVPLTNEEGEANLSHEKVQHLINHCKNSGNPVVLKQARAAP